MRITFTYREWSPIKIAYLYNYRKLKRYLSKGNAFCYNRHMNNTLRHRLSNKDIINMKATCSLCGEVDIKKNHNAYTCSNQKKVAKLYAKYGLRIEPHNIPKYCEICGSSKKISLDHDHNTKIIRGWLCGNCNTALGMVNDNIEILRKLIKYLEH